MHAWVPLRRSIPHGKRPALSSTRIRERPSSRSAFPPCAGRGNRTLHVQYPLWVFSLLRTKMPRNGFDSPLWRKRQRTIVTSFLCAGRGNRTLDSSLARTCSTTKPYPQSPDYTIFLLIIQLFQFFGKKFLSTTSEGLGGRYERAKH